MKEFSHHEPCPKCQSKDNLGVWTDGQKWCFGCGFLVKVTSQMSNSEIEKRVLQQEEKTPSASAICLPSDFTHLVRVDGFRWLNKYGISQKEQSDHRIGWSDKYESLVFPVYDVCDNLLLVQRRYFGNEKFPKYSTKGSPESTFHFMGPHTNTLILVEDFVSAIKISRQFTVMPLWGSNLSMRQISIISSQFDGLCLWLDSDKTKEAVKFKWRASPFFKHVAIIASALDPKEYNDDAIAQFVLGNA